MARLKKNKRKIAEKKGRRAEYLAALFLLCKGYQIIKIRYKVSHGEIDIIAKKKDLICFIEVKARKSLSLAVDAVSENSKRRIIAAGGIWHSYSKTAEELSFRNDIIAITPWRLPIHIKNAF